MSTQPYSVGDNVELSYRIGSTASTQPETAAVHLIVTDPTGIDSKYTTASGLSKSVPTSDSTTEGWALWKKVLLLNVPGRWTYQFTSTGSILTSAGNALGVARPLASTST